MLLKYSKALVIVSSASFRSGSSRVALTVGLYFASIWAWNIICEITFYTSTSMHMTGRTMREREREREREKRERPPLLNAHGTCGFHLKAWHPCHTNLQAQISFFGADFYGREILQKHLYSWSTLQYLYDVPSNPAKDIGIAGQEEICYWLSYWLCEA